MVKMISPFCIDDVPFLISSLLSYGVFPKAWKEAIVISYPKINSPIKFFDLSPISVLHAISKVLEKVFVDQSVEFREIKHILPPFQAGFHNG